MKNTILIPEVYLHALNSSDIGNNLPHINTGYMQSQFSSYVSSHISTLSSTQYLTLSGHGLDLLYEESPELISQLSETLHQGAELVGVPYHNSALRLLSPAHFKRQWKQTNDIFEKHFSKRSKKLYVGSQAIPKQLSSAIAELELEIIGDNSLDISSAPLGSTHEKHINLDVGAHSPFHNMKNLNELTDHVEHELLGLEPYSLEDPQLAHTWSNLSSTCVFSKLDGDDPQQNYETYFSVMHILNDMAHTIRNVELSKRGEFESTPEIVESPTQKVLEVMQREVNYHA